MNEWFMTVDYPGGEYAGSVDAICTAVGCGLTQAERDNLKAGRAAGLSGWEQFDEAMDIRSVCIRPCPPDLAEWLAPDAHCWHNHHGQSRMRVPGGWLYNHKASYTFIPVSGSSGLTVLEQA